MLKGDVVNEVSKLKQELDGDIVVYASTQLVHTLIEHDLVDELRLTMYPIVLGAGERLFSETSDKKPMRLVGTRTVGDGLSFLTYQLVHVLSGCADLRCVDRRHLNGPVDGGLSVLVLAISVLLSP